MTLRLSPEAKAELDRLAGNLKTAARAAAQASMRQLTSRHPGGESKWPAAVRHAVAAEYERQLALRWPEYRKRERKLRRQDDRRPRPKQLPLF